MGEEGLMVEYSAKYPRGVVLCPFCIKRVHWPAYNAHVDRCFKTPPPEPKNPTGRDQ
jgi:hypothetical protein